MMNSKSFSFFDDKSTFWIPFFLGLLLIITLWLYLHFPSGYNQGLYHYQGLVIKNGGLPYSDFIEKKGPMGLLTYSLASLIFGETTMAYRIFDLLILSVTAFFLFRLSRLNNSVSISGAIVVFWSMYLLIDGPGNTADVTNIITACYVATAYYWTAPKIKNRFLIIGLLIGLACWVKPTALLVAIPLLIWIARYNVKYNVTEKTVLAFFMGILAPSLVFIVYLLITATFYEFWEAVVLDTVYNYAGNVSRFSFRVISKTARTFLNDPILRIGGLLALFAFSKNTLIKFFVVGIGLMLFVEGRLYPYQFSPLWPFLTLALVEGFINLNQRFIENKQKIILGLFCMLMAFPVVKTGSTFLNAGFLTKDFDTAQTFLVPDFQTMYNHRKPVVSYLKKQINQEDEILVLGIDTNIYLELDAITTCRLARSSGLLTIEPNTATPDHIIKWQHEVVGYMQAKKADWIIVLKRLPNQWAKRYQKEIDDIFSKKYTLEHTTEGHLIYKSI